MHCPPRVSVAAPLPAMFAAPACGGDDDGGSDPDAGTVDERGRVGDRRRHLGRHRHHRHRGAPVLTSTQGNVWGDTTGCTGAGDFASDATDDPVLGPLADNGGLTMTHDIGGGGSAVDAGDPDGCVDPAGGVLDVDQRGEPRPAAAECDSGALERQ